MKKILTSVAAVAALFLVASCGPKKAAAPAAEEITVPAHDNVPEYVIVNAPEVDLADFKVDEDGYYVLFDGTSLKGWRGYGKDHVPTRWTIEDGCLKFNGKGGGEQQGGDGGDLIFEKRFKNFELLFDWKVTRRANSGVFLLAREIKTLKDSVWKYSPIYISSPEYQILDNENHPDGQLGKVIGIRQSSSLYDMIVAEPQNANPYDEWNTGKIMVYEGTVVHGQNGANTCEYHLWTQDWTDLLNTSKFAQAKNPLAFELLNNVGGDEHAGYIGFQDHGDVVYYRNIRLKVLD
ncbi:MAG: DUF1080 domain-containing protein [Bacteroidales bacterium]|nr:DUF1080 domain-containing protein [Bacteroidales bacterium]